MQSKIYVTEFIIHILFEKEWQHMGKLTFNNFTIDGLATLDAYLEARGISRTKGDIGRAEGDGTRIDYEYDLSKGTLVLDLLNMPESHTNAHVSHVVQEMLNTNVPHGVAGKIARRISYEEAWG